MTTAVAAAVMAKCREERRLREGLPTTEAGQIADSYDTLHSVRLITVILETMPEALSGEARARYLFFLLARCFDVNLAELCLRASHDVGDGRTERAADTLLWIERLLRLKHDIALFQPWAPDRPLATLLPASPFLPALDGLSEALLKHFAQTGFPAIASAGSLALPEALLIQRAKNIVLLASEAGPGNAPPAEITAEIVAAHVDCVAAAAAGLTMNGSTHLNQFCLLHQIPELIGPTVLRLWESIETDLTSGDLHEAIEQTRFAGDLLSIMVLSIAPLAELLYPSEYFKFRGNLGATSGSSSVAIRGKLLTTAYVRLAERTVAVGMNQAGSARAHQHLMAQLSRNRGLLYKWRALHMALPRNVLGSDGTTSLMGSPDALKAVRAMADAFAVKDPLTAIFGPVEEFAFEPASATARLDAALLAETGRVARDVFQDVQQRRGTWAKT